VPYLTHDHPCRTILIILGGIGKFPASVEELKDMGVYNVYMAKYAMYIAAALLGIIGVILGKKALSVGVERQGSVPIALALIALAAALALATLGMTGWQCWKTSLYGPLQWYNWLIIALTIVQRLVYIWLCGTTMYLFRVSNRNAYQT
jgi:hypothetical protein